jgi:transcriptional regulator EpsA
MKRFVGLSARDMEHLVVTIDASLKITKRSQFYLWAQGALQGFIPHELLICAYGDIARMRFKFEVFTGGLFNAADENDVGDQANGLLPRIVDEWLRAGSTPCVFSPDGAGQTGRRQLFADLKRCSYGHVAAHGPKEMQGEFGSFFIFARTPHAPTARDLYLVELLMPYLHTALYRMLANESSGDVEEVADTTLLTKREIQVLHWVKNGKTNSEIAQILHLSPPTVKNHLQKIMRKLGVTNRAQAVGKGATLRLVVPGESN